MRITRARRLRVKPVLIVRVTADGFLSGPV